MSQAMPPRAPGRPFVGRASELEELRGALDETAEGRGFLFLLSGEPGIGKTRLMQELSREAGERGWRVAAGRCWEEGGATATTTTASPASRLSTTPTTPSG
jgi:MoxR-like ATPase